MSWENLVQKETHGKLREYLSELFEEPVEDAETAHFYVRYGSTILEISVEPQGEDEAIIMVMAYCAQGVKPHPDLLLGLLELNQILPFGAFSLVGEDVFFSHALFGSSLQRSNLLGAITAVASVSDDYDDRIVAKYGGQTALDRIRDTGGREPRRRRARSIKRPGTDAN